MICPQCKRDEELINNNYAYCSYPEDIYFKCKCGDCDNKLQGKPEDWSDEILDKTTLILTSYQKRIDKEKKQRDPDFIVLYLQRCCNTSLTWLTGIREHKLIIDGSKYTSKNWRWSEDEISFTKSYRQRLISEANTTILNLIHDNLSCLKLAVDDMLELMEKDLNKK